jgi:hypothetical protein
LTRERTIPMQATRRVEHVSTFRGDGQMGDKGPGSKSKDKKKKGAKTDKKK